jgi:hypothetical protein
MFVSGICHLQHPRAQDCFFCSVFMFLTCLGKMPQFALLAQFTKLDDAKDQISGTFLWHSRVALPAPFLEIPLVLVARHNHHRLSVGACAIYGTLVCLLRLNP